MTLRDFLIGFCCFFAGQIITIIYYCIFAINPLEEPEKKEGKPHETTH